MSLIDWEAGPSGATHFVPAKSHNHSDIFILVDGMTVKKVGYPGGDRWAHTYTADSQPSIDLGRAISKREEPAAWAGEGLPPVDEWCEILSMPEPKGAWCKGKILYISSSSCVWCWSENQIDMCANTFEMEFRPIRTPKQIAAEEREAELNKMVATVSMLDKGWAMKVCAGLYDAGYRKFEILDN